MQDPCSWPGERCKETEACPVLQHPLYIFPVWQGQQEQCLLHATLVWLKNLLQNSMARIHFCTTWQIGPDALWLLQAASSYGENTDLMVHQAPVAPPFTKILFWIISALYDKEGETRRTTLGRERPSSPVLAWCGWCPQMPAVSGAWSCLHCPVPRGGFSPPGLGHFSVYAGLTINPKSTRYRL